MIKEALWDGMGSGWVVIGILRAHSMLIRKTLGHIGNFDNHADLSVFLCATQTGDEREREEL